LALEDLISGSLLIDGCSLSTVDAAGRCNTPALCEQVCCKNQHRLQPLQRYFTPPAELLEAGAPAGALAGAEALVVAAWCDFL
jgi:hypothetical protein